MVSLGCKIIKHSNRLPKGEFVGKFYIQFTRIPQSQTLHACSSKYTSFQSKAFRNIYSPALSIFCWSLLVPVEYRKLAITNLITSWTRTTLDFTTPLGVKAFTNDGCTPNCRARRAMKIIPSVLRLSDFPPVWSLDTSPSPPPPLSARSGGKKLPASRPLRGLAAGGWGRSRRRAVKAEVRAANADADGVVRHRNTPALWSNRVKAPSRIIGLPRLSRMMNLRSHLFLLYCGNGLVPLSLYS